jgi:hypothetical protein
MTPEWGHATPRKLWPKANAQLAVERLKLEAARESG